MLVKHENCVINLDNVTEFICYRTCEIKFFFDSYDIHESQICFSILEFTTECERNEAFEEILEAFTFGNPICFLDE